MARESEAMGRPNYWPLSAEKFQKKEARMGPARVATAREGAMPGHHATPLGHAISAPQGRRRSERLP